MIQTLNIKCPFCGCAVVYYINTCSKGYFRFFCRYGGTFCAVGVFSETKESAWVSFVTSFEKCLTRN